MTDQEFDAMVKMAREAIKRGPDPEPEMVREGPRSYIPANNPQYTVTLPVANT